MVVGPLSLFCPSPSQCSFTSDYTIVCGYNSHYWAKLAIGNFLQLKDCLFFVYTLKPPTNYNNRWANRGLDLFQNQKAPKDIIAKYLRVPVPKTLAQGMYDGKQTIFDRKK
jgi:hypothetical protein